jgi:predicted kinase
MNDSSSAPNIKVSGTLLFFVSMAYIVTLANAFKVPYRSSSRSLMPWRYNIFPAAFSMSMTPEDMNKRAIELLKSKQLRCRQLMIILVGIAGCGKSTFARKIAGESVASVLMASEEKQRSIFESIHYGQRFTILNQDRLKKRKNVEKHAQLALQYGDSVIIDRTNVDAQQRSYWVRIAEVAQTDFKIPTLCVVLPCSDDYAYCVQRAKARGDDGVHTGEEDWELICKRFVKEYRQPAVDEGFDMIYTCRNEEDLMQMEEILCCRGTSTSD